MSDAFPLDFDLLVKGEVITQERIERIYGVRYAKDQSAFTLRALALSKRISEERPELLARVDGTSVRVMTDLEADEWTKSEWCRGVRIIGRNAKRRAQIDRSGFNDEQKRIAEARDNAITAMALLTHKELAKARREELLLKGAPEAAE